MRKKSHILGIIPARSGSKGIPGKNLRPLLGKPLIAWAANALVNAEEVDLSICSTNDSEIAGTARKFGLEVPWLRPEKLAEDDTLVVDVISHALESLAESYSHVALVQATSPTVTSNDIDSAIRLALEQDADTVITGFHAGQRHPSTMYTLNSDSEVCWLLDDGKTMARRQDLEAVYIRTGLVYVIKKDLIIEKKSIYGERIAALTIEEERSITIDEEADFKLAERYLKENTNE